jgi:DNA invertase Pin-like site-specific DNA recombinase
MTAKATVAQPLKVAAYIRVSTDRQAEEGQGLDVQRRAIRQWAKSNGHLVTMWTADEGLSGSNGLDSRAGLLEALSAVSEQSVTGIVVYRLDRLARDLVLQEQLLAEVWRVGGRVFSTSPSEDAYLDPNGADTDPSRKLIRQVLGAVAEYERSMIRLRMSAGRARKAERLRPESPTGHAYAYGAPPYGWRADGRELVPVPEEQLVLARIAELRESGTSLRGVAACLKDDGFKPRAFKRREHPDDWHPQTLRRIIARMEGVAR